MVLGLLNQLQIFSQLYLIELLGLSTGLGLLELWHLIYSRLLTGFGMLVFFTNLILLEYQVRYLALFLLFSVIDSLERFWIESLHKNIQLRMEILKAPFLVLHLSVYTLMVFLMMLSVVLISMLIIVNQKCDEASDLWKQLEQASEVESDLQDTVNWGKKWLVDFNAGKTQLVLFHWFYWCEDGWVFSWRKISFKMTGLTFSSKLDWGSYMISIAKTTSMKIGAWIRSIEFPSCEVALYLYKFTIQSCREYCCHIWTGVPSCYLELFDKLQKEICRTVGPSFAASLEPLGHHWNVASLSLFCRYYFVRCSSKLAQLVSLPFSPGRSTHYSDRMHDFSVTIPRCYKDVYVNSFFPCAAILWNSLYRECFPLTYNLCGFIKSRINRDLLTVGNF